MPSPTHIRKIITIFNRGNINDSLVNTVTPVISGTQVVDSTLTSTTGTWSELSTYTYQWYRGISLISGATSSTYTLVQADAGNTSNITCQVTATSSGGSAIATSNTLTQILDLDANAFLTAASISDSTEKNAVNSLTIDLKTASIWTKMKAVYPFVGGTSTTHKWNLKNPLDTDAAYRLTFSGGWVHSANGALPNGTNGYANTYLNALTDLLQFSHHHSFYHNTDNVDIIGRSLGGVQASGSINFRTTLEGSGTQIAFRDLGGVNSDSGYTSSTLKGFRASSRIANNNQFQIKQDGTATTPTTSIVANNLPSLNCYLAAEANTLAPSRYSIMQIAFHSIGDGLTTSEGLSLRNAINTFQTTLGRNV